MRIAALWPLMLFLTKLRLVVKQEAQITGGQGENYSPDFVTSRTKEVIFMQGFQAGCPAPWHSCPPDKFAVNLNSVY